MFDDQIPKASGQVPGNLPIGEPDDMFSDVEPTPEPAEATNPTEVVEPEAPASALGAGVLRPVEEVSEPANLATEEKVETTPKISTMPDLGSDPVNSKASPANDIYAIKEPALTRGLVTMIIVVIGVVILGAGSWWIYNSFMKVPLEDDFVVPAVNLLDAEEEDATLPAPEVVEPVEVVSDEVLLPTDDLTQDIIDDQILFGEPIDKDGDSLDDERELEIGTDPNNWDTDGDELGDGDEVIIWKTDPNNWDTDGDTFPDGQEIKNGYNPDGPGKLFEPPVEEGLGAEESGV